MFRKEIKIMFTKETEYFKCGFQREYISSFYVSLSVLAELQCVVNILYTNVNIIISNDRMASFSVFFWLQLYTLVCLTRKWSDSRNK